MKSEFKDNTSAVTNLLLNELGIPTTSAFLKREIQSHPDYPSLFAISDTLDVYKVKNEALRINKAELESITLPFIAHLTINNGNFCVVTDITDESVSFQIDYSTRRTLKKGDFQNIWDNIILRAETSTESAEPDYIKNKQKANYLKYRFPVFISLITSIVFLSLFINSSLISSLPLLFTQAIGLFFIYLLVKHELGEQNNIIESLCTLTKSAGCNEVLNSKASKIFDNIQLADIGLVWFVSSFFYLIIQIGQGDNIHQINIIALLTFASIPFITFSLIYQAFIIKKYCPMCLGVISVLIIDCILFLTYFHWKFEIPDLSSSIQLFIIFICITFIWMILRPFLVDNSRLHDFEIKFTNLKRHSDVFNALLSEGKSYNTNELFGSIKLLGNNSPATITKIINPFCSPCEKAINEAIELVRESKDNLINFQFAFLVPTMDKEDVITKTAAHFIALQNNSLSNNMLEITSDWFKIKDYELWSRKYPCIITDAHREILEKQVQWCHMNEIHSTPFSIINNKIMPSIYDIKDIRYIFN